MIVLKVSTSQLLAMQLFTWSVQPTVMLSLAGEHEASHLHELVHVFIMKGRLTSADTNTLPSVDRSKVRLSTCMHMHALNLVILRVCFEPLSAAAWNSSLATS